MGVSGDFDSQNRGLWGFKGLMRRKQVDSARKEVDGGHHQLAKELSVLHLVAIGNPSSFLGSVLHFLGRWIFHGFLDFCFEYGIIKHELFLWFFF